MGGLPTAKFKLNLDIPNDFSLIGFDDIPSASWPGHSLTTIRQPVRRMIQQALEILIEHMENPHLEARECRFSGTLIVRDSVRFG